MGYRELERRIARIERALIVIYLQLGIDQEEIDTEQAEIEALQTRGSTYPATTALTVKAA